ncbi:MAG: cobalamin B12-binding domain-containing protein [Deltaproteobacteria bacterium]|nr:cobalamin B12-binding domain-containing protein [Deltaproteobacteria bacterium]
MPQNPQTYTLRNPVRIVTAASLFDGHDASINIMRRIMQASGGEVIHLGHNRSVDDIVTAAIDEDAGAVAASCYQGGHIEFFKYMRDLLNERGAKHIQIFGGGGGVIVPEEIKELEAYGVSKIYSPDHGRKMGLQGMINHLLKSIDKPVKEDIPGLSVDSLSPDRKLHVARTITLMEQTLMGEDGHLTALRNRLREKAEQAAVPVLGITGTGGSGKSSLTDELVLRFLYDFPDKTVGILAVDPTRRKSGGALLGDRIRMNAINNPRVYLRSLATRQSQNELSEVLREGIWVLKAAGYDLVIVETAGIGQGDAAVAELVDIALYVMTSEFGAASQLEKIDMLDFADLVAINKFERKGSEDALRDVRKQYQRNHELWDQSPDTMPVYGTIAAKFNDDGVTALYHGILDTARRKLGVEWKTRMPRSGYKVSSSKSIIIPAERTRYLSEIGENVRAYHRETEEQSDLARKAWALKEALKQVEQALAETGQSALDLLKKEIAKAEQGLSPESVKLLEDWPRLVERYSAEEFAYLVRGKEVKVPLNTVSLAGKKIPKVSLPKFSDPGEIIRWLREENVPGKFPFTAGVFPFKRVDEDPTRMFAGEGDPVRTNRRFKYLSRNSEAKRLSTAFDSVTLYGQDPDTRPDIYGKVGNSGVSVCTLDDVRVLYGGFDLCAPNTSVSMTINGPAPIMLAMFFNAALDQQVAAFQSEQGRTPTPEELEKMKASVLQNIRGTVQADVLKEDQGQNTCIFSIEFALRMMGDIQQYFIDHNVRNYYSVSISGYHIAEAGANPITQLAFTMANGFTYVEYYLSRGMHIDSFAPNLSFFFSNGMDAEYTVIGRVARRIWAIAMKKKYGGAERSQMLKYHIQTSGRSLHSLEVNFNDIRTTLQALCAIYDNCNSLHTNAYDEAITTPSEESVRRALAIQLIINREWGLAKNENPYQGSFIVEELTKLVEEAVLEEFDRLTERGGVLGAMETGYQRSKIQEESLVYEARKHTGELPIIGVNTFLSPHATEGEEEFCLVELTRATEEEKQNQLKRLHEFHSMHAEETPPALERLKETALTGGNIFEELMKTTRICSLGQITKALYEVGGQYRRAM